MVLGRTNLVIKDELKGAEVQQHVCQRPSNCSRVSWRSGVCTSRLKWLELEGCRRCTRGTKDQLLIDKMVIKTCGRRHTNLNMARIDCKKAYDMVPHTWIPASVTIVDLAGNIKRLVKNTMDS